MKSWIGKKKFLFLLFTKMKLSVCEIQNLGGAILKNS